MLESESSLQGEYAAGAHEKHVESLRLGSVVYTRGSRCGICPVSRLSRIRRSLSNSRVASPKLFICEI